MSIFPPTRPEPADAGTCPPWCTRSAGHDAGQEYRRHEGELVAVPASVDYGAPYLAEVTVVRDDHRDEPGQPVVALADLEVTADRTRDLSLSLLAAADTIERAPRRLGGPPRHRDRPIMPRYLHDVWCGWRIATRAEDRPELAWCAGCGLAVEIGAPSGGAR